MLWSVVPPAAAQGVSDSEQQCRLALSAAEDLLVNGRNLWITELSVEDVGASYTNHPYQSPMELTFGLAGNTAPDIMASPRLMTTITTTVVNGCPQVGLVTFIVSDTDWATSFGLIGNQVREFECIDPGEEGPIRWGYQVCM